jgi:hypothetical protein
MQKSFKIKEQNKLFIIKGNIWDHVASLTNPIVIEVPVRNQENKKSCKCEL